MKSLKNLIAFAALLYLYCQSQEKSSKSTLRIMPSGEELDRPDSSLPKLRELTSIFEKSKDQPFLSVLESIPLPFSTQLLPKSFLSFISKEQTFGQILNDPEKLGELKEYVHQHLPKEEQRKLQSLCTDDLITQIIAGGNVTPQDTLECLNLFGDIDNAILCFQGALHQYRNNSRIRAYCQILLNNGPFWSDLVLVGASQPVLTNFTSALQSIISPETSRTTTITLSPAPTSSEEPTQTPTTLAITTTPTTFGYFTNTTTSANPTTNTTTFTNTTTTPPTTYTLTTNATTGETTATTTTGTSFVYNQTTQRWHSTSGETGATIPPFIPVKTTPPTYFVSTTPDALQGTSSSTTSGALVNPITGTSQLATRTTSQDSTKGATTIITTITPTTSETQSTTYSVTLSILSSTSSTKYDVTATTTANGTTEYKITDNTTQKTTIFISTNGADPQPVSGENGDTTNKAVTGGVVGGVVGGSAVIAAVAVAIHRKRNKKGLPVGSRQEVKGDLESVPVADEITPSNGVACPVGLPVTQEGQLPFVATM